MDLIGRKSKCDEMCVYKAYGPPPHLHGWIKGHQAAGPLAGASSVVR
jgi:hypothetical protein